MVIGFFFFQAEDGIRDLVRSRGLGDVYKRQQAIGRAIGQLQRLRLGVEAVNGRHRAENFLDGIRRATAIHQGRRHEITAVSYTHLTLPTSDLV